MINKTLAYVFPGQGSQSVGMLSDIAGEFPEVIQTFNEASTVLHYDLWNVVKNGPAVELDKTVHTQPALLAASYALWRIIEQQNGTKPGMLAGHSLGEYTALVCAGALAFADAIQLVAARGQFMQEAVPQGTGSMAAIIGIEDAQVAALCAEAKAQEEVLAPANFNTPGQVVIAGHQTAVDRAVSLAKNYGAKLAMLIPVSVPSHCELMRPAAEKLAKLLADTAIQLPTVPVISNISADSYNSIEAIRTGLVRQLYSPVRWVDSIRYFVASGIKQIVECGPGKVLTGLNKRIDKNLLLKTASDLICLEGATGEGSLHV